MRSFNPIYTHLEKLPEGEFNIYLPKLKLVRKNTQINGVGHLFINEGKFVLKVINNSPPDKITESWNFFGQEDGIHEIGKLQSAADYCYILNAEDDHGNQYQCDYVSIEFDFERVLYTGGFKSVISIFSEEGIKGTKNHASIVLKNKYNFATNQQKYDQITFSTYLDDRAKFKNIWEIQSEDLSLTLYSDTKHLILDAYSNHLDFDNTIIKQILDSLNFVMGLEHAYYYLVLFGEENSFHIKLNTIPNSPRKTIFTPPYRQTGSIGDEADENTKLFWSYFNYLTKVPQCLFNKLHKRIVDSGTGYYYKHGLIISTSIESILRNYYPKEPELPSESFLSDTKTLKGDLAKFTDSVFLARLNAFISGLTSNKSYIPGKMLEKLEKEGVIGPGSLAAWRNLRNRFAHGDDYNDELSKAAGLVQQNVTIFYELIFNIIEYNGKYTRYSIKEGNRLSTYPLANGK
jgi:hypothetical protein